MDHDGKQRTQSRTTESRYNYWQVDKIVAASPGVRAAHG